MTRLVPLNAHGDASPDGYETFTNVIEDFFNRTWHSDQQLRCSTFKVDVRENGREYLIDAEVPGIARENIKLNVNEQTLCIAVKKQEESAANDGRYVHRERRSTAMSRSIRLIDAKWDQIHAKLENGILHIAVTKTRREETQREITID
jgi:HSP20 family protein